MQRVQFSRTAQPFDGGDLAAIRLSHCNHTGAGLASVDQDRAGPAITGIAADFCAGQRKVVAQRIGQSFKGIALIVASFAIQREL